MAFSDPVPTSSLAQRKKPREIGTTQVYGLQLAGPREKNENVAEEQQQDGLQIATTSSASRDTMRAPKGFAGEILDWTYLLAYLLEESAEKEERVYGVLRMTPPFGQQLEAKEYTFVGVPKPLQESRRRNMKRNMKRLLKDGVFEAKVQHEGKTFLVYRTGVVDAEDEREQVVKEMIQHGLDPRELVIF
jgi:hypothetical protein